MVSARDVIIDQIITETHRISIRQILYLFFKQAVFFLLENRLRSLKGKTPVIPKVSIRPLAPTGQLLKATPGKSSLSALDSEFAASAAALQPKSSLQLSTQGGKWL